MLSRSQLGHGGPGLEQQTQKRLTFITRKQCSIIDIQKQVMFLLNFQFIKTIQKENGLVSRDCLLCLRLAIFQVAKDKEASPSTLV